MLSESEHAFRIMSGFGHSSVYRMAETMVVYHVQRGTALEESEYLWDGCKNRDLALQCLG
jgi:hypothetical protein